MLKTAFRSARALLRDEGGQTMLEYIVIVVFVVIAAMVAFRIVAGIVNRGSQTLEASVGPDL
jgi:Flp pilus assembly pilin Flp